MKEYNKDSRQDYCIITLSCRQTNYEPEVPIILLEHKITGYGTINQIHMLPKHELIMGLQDKEQVWLQFFIRG